MTIIYRQRYNSQSRTSRIDIILKTSDIPELWVVELTVHDDGLEERSFAYDELDHSMNEGELCPDREKSTHRASRGRRTRPHGHRPGLLDK